MPSDERPDREIPYDTLYEAKEYYWGKKPSSSCEKLLEIFGPIEGRPKLLDLGCGEGRNAIHLAKHGFEATGLDKSRNGLKKTLELASSVGLEVKTILGDIKDCRLASGWDVIFSTGTIHYLPPEMREERFAHFKEVTVGGGVHAISVFVKKPFIPRAPDGNSAAPSFRSGELLGYYWDWEILFCTEEIFDCNSGGEPHKHAVNRVVARKV
ncbi:MAG: methyltransferase domain-containing protein [Candidatus Coatesbacteria bacterium]|nr:methyltransferase domain-containing protein [Candidatus Coatesbacteria bacterium]